MSETPEEHKRKHGKDVQELWDEVEKRDSDSVKEHHDKKHRDFEEESTEESEEEKEEE